MSVALVTGSKAHPKAERGLDLYQTHPAAVEALIENEPLPHHIWEPACGPGNIVEVLRKTGRTVYASDVINYSVTDEVIDFFDVKQTRVDIEAIITNPPYNKANQFVEHALAMAPKVCMLMRLAFIEGVKRSPLLDGGKLSRVMVFKRRLPMMHREGWEGPKASSAIPFAWFIWDRHHTGDTRLSRIDWKKPEAANDNDGSLAKTAAA